ncbi:hypothetical protein FISHEDRAFT_77339 [Fistulina hepatica ATCC 64428]|uniref:Hydrophobin n=1 Tax=Fistulina hepatica ATCC 64428 TaxID=1128425 RepID=A0A0D7A1M4_9AGAR|nr:hypothetical protein FISHEDRAFT_77339 [Fistulina hepatica ATCC 64428]
MHAGLWFPSETNVKFQKRTRDFSCVDLFAGAAYPLAFAVSFSAMRISPSRLVFAMLAVAGSHVAATTVTTTITVTAPSSTSAISPDQCVYNAVCCQTLGASGDSIIAALLNTLGVVLDAVEGLVGIYCTPIDLFGLTQPEECQNTPLCCTGIDDENLIAVGCVPINVNL